MSYHCENCGKHLVDATKSYMVRYQHEGLYLMSCETCDENARGECDYERAFFRDTGAIRTEYLHRRPAGGVR